MTVVYVAGPYTRPEPGENTHRAVMAGNRVLDAGMVPFIPHLSHFWHAMTPKPYAEWLRIDLAILARCDAVWRLPGDSDGADMEVAEARRLAIPVFHSLEALTEWVV